MRTESLAPRAPTASEGLKPRSVAPFVGGPSTIDERIADLKRTENSINKQYGFRSPEYEGLQALIQNYNYLKYHPPVKGPKQEKETTLNDIGKYLLDLTGYGATIASVLPIPAARIGGMVARGAVGAARAVSRGDYIGASRQIGRTAGYYYRANGPRRQNRKGTGQNVQNRRR